MSKTWLSPSDQSEKRRYHIHIVFSSDKLSRTGTINFLRMFTLSQIARKECRIEIDLDSPVDIEMMPPVFQVLAGLRTFEVVIVEITGQEGPYRRHSPEEYAQARSLWKQMRKDLESALGGYVYARHFSYCYMEFKPREYLAQNSPSP